MCKQEKPCTRVQVLEALVRVMVIREGRIMPQNEFDRKINNLAGKAGINPNELRAVLVPMMEEEFARMVNSSKPDTDVHVADGWTPTPPASAIEDVNKRGIPGTVFMGGSGNLVVEEETGKVEEKSS